MEIHAYKRTWDPQIEKAVRKLDPFCGVDAVRERVQSGHFQVFSIWFDREHLGVIFVRIDKRYDGAKELVLVYTVARDGISRPLTSYMGPVLDQIARNNGLPYIRIHSERRGIDRILEHSGYEFQESVFTKKVEA